MTRIITTALLAISLTFTSISAVPARAATNSNDLGAAAFGAFALIILGSIIRNNGLKSKGKGSSPSDMFFPPSKKPPKHPPKNHPKKPPHKSVVKRVLPGSCLFSLRGQNGTRGVYSKQCLNDEMRNVAQLPRTCQETVRIPFGRRAEVYGATCLNRHGYRMASNRR